MSNELENENIIIQIRAKLNHDKIKLWESPFFQTDDNVPSETELKNLANEFCHALKIPIEDCLKAIQELQQNALEKLRSKDEFQKSGLATFKVRAPTQFGKNKSFNIQIKLDVIGKDLIKCVADKLEVPQEKIKMVCSGKVIMLDKSLIHQKLMNGSQLMVLFMSVTQENAKNESIMYDRVQKIRSEAELLINANDKADFLSLEDQEGNPIYLPKIEKKSLLMALTLYEKGKVALKKEDFNEALLLFLEADRDFNVCNSQLLDTVDNYALLNLDIVWCYLCLKSFNQLPDAENRLRICEEKFRKSYGENMRRVVELKGQKSNEKALLLRLHLLKAVLFFHQNKREDAEIMFKVCESELNCLKIDDNCLSMLLEIGYSMRESRIALRACGNDLESSIEYIDVRRVKTEENEKRAKKEKSLYKSIGFNSEDGKRINIDFVDGLVDMGFNRELAGIALKRCNNDVDQALNELQGNEGSLKKELMDNVTASEDLITQIAAIGFDTQLAKVALKATLNNFEEAIEYLISMKNNGNYEEMLENCKTVPSTTPPVVTPICDNDQPGPSTSKKCKESKEEDNLDMMKILFESFSKDMDRHADTYLDISLVEEENILLEYKKLLNIV